MGFPANVKQQVLFLCDRFCALCGRKCTTNIEIHHIIHESNGGGNDIDNAIPLCYDCHEIVGRTNIGHPRGNNYTPGELKAKRNSLYERVKLTRSTPLQSMHSNLSNDQDMTTFRKFISLLPKNGSISSISSISWEGRHYPHYALDDLINAYDFIRADASFTFVDYDTQRFLDEFKHYLFDFYQFISSSLILNATSSHYEPLSDNTLIQPDAISLTVQKLIELHSKICELCEQKLAIPHNMYWEINPNNFF